MADTITGTTTEVLDYYSRNWEKIANCYALDEDELPVDPAWYRRRLYGKFIERARPASILDIGCGGGWTVLDALELGVDARGIEPVTELVTFGSQLLEKNGHDGGRIRQDDLASLASHEPGSEDAIALLSVLPHVPFATWDKVHGEISAALKPGGRYIAAYRNQLFDFFTFNSYTVETFDQALWNVPSAAALRNNDVLAALKGLMTNPDKPGAYFTVASDKSFGKLERVRNNPLEMPAYFARFGMAVDKITFYNFHAVPPLMANMVPDQKAIGHQMDLDMFEDWRGHFMAAMFVVEARKL